MTAPRDVEPIAPAETLDDWKAAAYRMRDEALKWARLLSAEREARLKAESRVDELEREHREDEDAACRLEELRVQLHLAEGSPEETASVVGMILDMDQEAMSELRERAEKAERRTEVLEKALRPLVDAMPNPKDAPRGPEDEWPVRALVGLTFGVIRAARRALAPQDDETGTP